jgi:hypothetical protein
MTGEGDPGVLTSAGLAARYGVSIRTVEGWRCKRTGPPWFFAGRQACYHLDDVVAWERANKAKLAAQQAAETASLRKSA